MFVCEQDNIHRSQSTNATTHHAEVNITMEFPFKICKVERASMEVLPYTHTINAHFQIVIAFVKMVTPLSLKVQF